MVFAQLGLGHCAEAGYQVWHGTVSNGCLFTLANGLGPLVETLTLTLVTFTMVWVWVTVVIHL